MKIESLSRAAFWLCVLTLLYLSLVPGTLRPQTGASGHFEHFIAYAGTGFLFAPGTTLRSRLFAALALTALSGAMELAQLSIPDRTGEFDGFFYSSLGAWLGIAGGSLVWSLWLAYRTQRA